MNNLKLGIEYICILDSADEFLLTKLEKQVTFLDENSDYGTVFLHEYHIAMNKKLAIFQI